MKNILEDLLIMPQIMRPKILVIDDDRLILYLFKNCLNKDNYDVTIAYSSLEALDLVKYRKFDLIFLDLLMPQLFGNKVFQGIRAIDKDVPIVIITGYPDSPLLKECAGFNPAAIMNKPFTIDEIFNAVQKYTGANTS